MRSRVVVALVGAAVLVSPSVASSKPPSKVRNCGELSGKEVLGRSGAVRLVQRFQGGSELYGPNAVQYACVGKRRPVRLTSAAGVIRSTVAVDATHAGFGYDEVDNACTKYMGDDPSCRFRGVLVYEVRTGRLVASRSDVTAVSLSLGADSVTFVTDEGASVTLPFG